MTKIDLSSFDILIVDDNAFIRRLLKEVLISFEVGRVREADTAQLALQEIAVAVPDIILCDWVMRPVDGLGFLKSLRDSVKFQRIPVIMITGNATPRHITQALGEGADSFIVKPFKPATLMEHIQRVIYANEAAYV